MGRLENEARTAMTVLLKQGHSQSSVARLLGVSEGTVRYHRRRDVAGAVDGRAAQVSKAAVVADAIAHWRSQQSGGRMNLAALHEWLKREHDYDGSLKSVQRYWKRTFPAPAIRARRRVETPIGAQAPGGLGRVSRHGDRPREGRPRCAGGDAVLEPEARGGLGAVEGHALVAGLPDCLPATAGRRSGGAQDRQRQDGDRQGCRRMGRNQRDLSAPRSRRGAERLNSTKTIPWPRGARSDSWRSARTPWPLPSRRTS